MRPGTYKALENHLSNITAKYGEGYYHVIHFDVHGAVLTYEQFQHIQKAPAGNPMKYQRYGRNEIQPYEDIKAFLSFEADNDEQKHTSDLVEASELADLLVKHHVPITILNACQSGKAAWCQRNQPGQPSHPGWPAACAGDGLFCHCQRR